MKRPIAAFVIGLLVGLTYSFAIQARVTVATIENMMARFNLATAEVISKSPGRPDRNRSTEETVMAKGSLLERLERDGEVHYP